MNVMTKIKAADTAKFVSELITITPDMAAQWLEMNTRNRKPRSGVIEKYARDMKSGRWQVTGDAIRFDSDANLIDGQHRLMACVKSGAPFSTLVIYGLQPDTQDVLDQGATRRAEDVLSLKGWQNVTGLAATARVLMAERDGLSGIKRKTYSTSEVMACIDKHSIMSRYIPAPGVLPRGISIAQVGFLRYISAAFFENGDATQSAMLEVLRTGVPTYQGDPIHAYRERILRMSDDITKINREARWNTFKHAFNLFRKKEPVTHLRFGRDTCSITGLDLKKL